MKIDSPSSAAAVADVARRELRIGSVATTIGELYRHVGIFGATGTGKTRGALLPLVEQILTVCGTGEETKAGLLVIDAKGDMAEAISTCADRSGRKDDVVIIGEGGDAWMRPFASCAEDSRSIAEFLLRTAEHTAAQGRPHEDPFWTENRRRLLTHAVTVAKAQSYGASPAISAIHRAVSTITTAVRSGVTDERGHAREILGFSVGSILTELRQAVRLHTLSASESVAAQHYLLGEAAHLPDRTWSCIQSFVHSTTSLFLDGPLRSLIEGGPENAEVVPAQIFDGGKIVVVALSPAVYGPSARAIRRWMKSLFQQTVLQRYRLVFYDGVCERKVNQDRPVFLVMDEFHTLVDGGDAESGDAAFFDRAREARCGCLMATQGISALRCALAEPAAEHLLNNIATKICFSVDCPTTAEYMERAAGRLATPNRQVTRRLSLPPPRFRVDGVPRPEGMQVVEEGAVEGESFTPACRQSELRALPVGEAMVFQSCGKLTRTQFVPWQAPHVA